MTHSELGVADGVVPNGTTVFADEIPGVTNLDPDLLADIGPADLPQRTLALRTSSRSHRSRLPALEAAAWRMNGTR